MSLTLQFALNCFKTYCLAGADPEISERGDRKPNSRKGVRNLTFQCGFQSFCYKSLTNIPAKGVGGGGRGAGGPSGPSHKSAPEYKYSGHQRNEVFVFHRKVDFGLFSSVPKPNWYMDSRDDFALILSALHLVFKTKISFLVKFDSKV